MSKKNHELNSQAKTYDTMLRMMRYAKPIAHWLLLACVLAMVTIICALATPPFWAI